jgi:methylamine utilization protein MauE
MGDRAARVARESLRVMIGLVLLATAAGKLLDIPGFARILEDYEVFSRGASLWIAWLVSGAELVLALWLFSARRLAAAAACALLLHLLYAVWSAKALVRGLRLSNCGCFGVFLPRPLTWGTAAEDVAMAALSAALVALARREMTRLLALHLPD